MTSWEKFSVIVTLVQKCNFTVIAVIHWEIYYNIAQAISYIIIVQITVDNNVVLFSINHGKIVHYWMRITEITFSIVYSYFYDYYFE